MVVDFRLENIEMAAQAFLAALSTQKVIAFHGEMGAGKTTFIKELAKVLGVSDTTSSPTFSLVNEYLADNGDFIYHFDVYRLKDENEALDMGIEEYLYSGNWCFIEWAEKIPNLIPKNHTVITIEALPNGDRKLTLL